MPDGKGAGELVVLPLFRAEPLPGCRFRVTRKFVEGMESFAARWPGRTVAILPIGIDATGSLDPVDVGPDDHAFRIEPRPPDEARLAQRLRGASAVLAVLEAAEAGLVRRFGQTGPAVVYVSEITRKTQRKIIAIEVANPLRRWKRQIQADLAERAKVAAVRASAGLQCNGLPTYDAYRDHSPNAMLFFDTRVRGDMVISEAALTQRLHAMSAGGPLRMVFSGRLTAIKGVEDLPELAHALVQLGVSFSLDIFGGGPLGPALEKAIARYGLEDRVRLRGVLEFESQLVPELKAGADLFICCHPQGDPSCTYLETMACGVPIAGYDNEAHAGLVRHARTGWATPIGDVQALARQIRVLHEDRTQLRKASVRAREFASSHTLEATFDARVNHLIECSRRKRDRVGAGVLSAT